MFFKPKSKLISEDADNQELRKTFNKKFCSLKLGRRVECGNHLWWLTEPIKTVQKGKDVYHVSNAPFFSTEQGAKVGETTVHTLCFLVKNKEKFSNLLITHKADHLPGTNVFANDRIEVIFNKRHIPLPKTTDIFDKYDLRFQLRNDKEARQFFDDFVIVSEIDRKHYKLYEAQQLYHQKRANTLQRKIQGRQRA